MNKTDIKINKKWEEMSDEERLVMVKFFPEEAKIDVHWEVRLEYFRVNGFTEEAKTDTDGDIRREAEIYFSLITEKKVTEKRTIIVDGVTYKEI